MAQLVISSSARNCRRFCLSFSHTICIICFLRCKVLGKIRKCCLVLFEFRSRGTYHPYHGLWCIGRWCCIDWLSPWARRVKLRKSFEHSTGREREKEHSWAENEMHPACWCTQLVEAVDMLKSREIPRSVHPSSTCDHMSHYEIGFHHSEKDTSFLLLQFYLFIYQDLSFHRVLNSKFLSCNPFSSFLDRLTT